MLVRETSHVGVLDQSYVHKDSYLAEFEIYDPSSGKPIVGKKIHVRLEDRPNDPRVGGITDTYTTDSKGIIQISYWDHVGPETVSFYVSLTPLPEGRAITWRKLFALGGDFTRPVPRYRIPNVTIEEQARAAKPTAAELPKGVTKLVDETSEETGEEKAVVLSASEEFPIYLLLGGIAIVSTVAYFLLKKK